MISTTASGNSSLSLVAYSIAQINSAKKALARGDMVSISAWGLPAYFSSLAKLANVLRMKFHKVKEA